MLSYLNKFSFFIEDHLHGLLIWTNDRHNINALVLFIYGIFHFFYAWMNFCLCWFMLRGIHDTHCKRIFSVSLSNRSIELYLNNNCKNITLLYFLMCFVSWNRNFRPELDTPGMLVNVHFVYSLSGEYIQNKILRLVLLRETLFVKASMNSISPILYQSHDKRRLTFLLKHGSTCFELYKAFWDNIMIFFHQKQYIFLHTSKES